jgi:excisionase family DNA binding protein
MSDPKLFLSLSEAAKASGVSRHTLAKHIHLGNLRAKRTAATGGKTLVRTSDLEAWFDGLEDA